MAVSAFVSSSFPLNEAGRVMLGNRPPYSESLVFSVSFPFLDFDTAQALCLSACLGSHLRHRSDLCLVLQEAFCVLYVAVGDGGNSAVLAGPSARVEEAKAALQVREEVSHE